MKRLLAVWVCGASLAGVASAIVIPVNCNLFFNGSNAVQIAWNAYPGESYIIQTTTNLAQAWQNAPTIPANLITATNWLSYSFPVAGKAQFFKVVKLDTDGPAVYKTSPFNGAIGVNPQATIQAWLQDETGVDTNTIALTVGTNAPVSLKDPRLSYVGGVLTYTPSTNEFFGTNGQIVTFALAVADTLGNQTTNFTWSFQLALSPVISTNIVFLGGTNPAPCNLTLLSTNGGYFTFSYIGSCCLTTGMQLVNTNPYTGYACAVVSFMDYPASNTVVALTRPSTLAELLQAGTLSSGAFSSLTNSAGGFVHPKDLGAGVDFPLQYTFPLGHVLYQDANLLVETTPDSQLSLSASLQLAANFQEFHLTALQAQITGSATFNLDLYARATATENLEDSIPLITPQHHPYFAMIGPVPVWVDVVLTVTGGYTADFSASAEITTGISASKTISVGKKWDSVNGWRDIYDNPPVSLAVLGPTWQLQGSADIRAYLQPQVSVLIYSLAGVSADLEPYLELSGSAQLNPLHWDLGLYAGLDSTIGLALSAWDSNQPDLPSITLNLIPRQTLWEDSGPPSQPTAPQITVQPQSQTACPGAIVSFSVQAQGSGPLAYQWCKNGLYLTDDTRITGSGSGTLTIAGIQSSDAGNYGVRVGNVDGAVTSSNATLTVPSGCTLSATVGVPSTANPWLAGMPDGSVAGAGYDTAPQESPVQVVGVPVTAGAIFTFSAAGQANNHPGAGLAATGPEGDGGMIWSRTPGAENGIANIYAPRCALLGVFLDDNIPSQFSAPAALNFSTQGERDFLTLQPALRQPFFIGDGLTSGSVAQQVIAPLGATRLFLGPMDSYQWANNVGSFTVTVLRMNSGHTVRPTKS